MLKKSKPLSQPLFKRLWERSQTKYLAYTQAISSALLISASQLNNAVTSPVISSALDRLSLPAWFPWLLLALAGLTYLAHGHGDDA